MFALQHYAVKTLENLYTRTDLWTTSLAQPSIAGKYRPLLAELTQLACSAFALVIVPSVGEMWQAVL